MTRHRILLKKERTYNNEQMSLALDRGHSHAHSSSGSVTVLQAQPQFAAASPPHRRCVAAAPSSAEITS